MEMNVGEDGMYHGVAFPGDPGEDGQPFDKMEADMLEHQELLDELRALGDGQLGPEEPEEPGCARFHRAVVQCAQAVDVDSDGNVDDDAFDAAAAQAAAEVEAEAEAAKLAAEDHQQEHLYNFARKDDRRVTGVVESQQLTQPTASQDAAFAVAAGNANGGGDTAFYDFATQHTYTAEEQRVIEAALKKHHEQKPVITHCEAGRRLADLQGRLKRQRTLAAATEENMKKWENCVRRCVVEFDDHKVCSCVLSAAS